MGGLLGRTGGLRGNSEGLAGRTVGLRGRTPRFDAAGNRCGLHHRQRRAIRAALDPLNRPANLMRARHPCSSRPTWLFTA